MKRLINRRFVSVTAIYEWVDKDNSKLYPECCGTKQLIQRNNN